MQKLIDEMRRTAENHRAQTGAHARQWRGRDVLDTTR